MLSDASRKRILKLLNLTASPEDHEALSAIRRVNELLVKEGLSWTTVLGPSSDQNLFGFAWGPPFTANARKDQSEAARPTRQAADAYVRQRAARAKPASNGADFSSVEEFESDWLNIHGKGPRFWIYDGVKVRSILDQLLNRGLVLSTKELSFVQLAQERFAAERRMTDLQFATLAALLEREVRAGVRRF